jgi:outer membrane protein OmpA-like peptidoglycan-associated protein
MSIRRCSAALLGLWLVAQATAAAAQFTPPRIRYVVNPTNSGRADQSNLSERVYYIDKGQTASINEGDVLNVYREKRIAAHIPVPMRVFIGTMTITNAYQTSSVGEFTPNEAGISHPVIRHKVAMNNDIVVPRLVIDNSVLFDPGSFELKAGARDEFAKVAEFVKLFSPNKLVIEGHTDSDGEADANRALSEQRAKNVQDWLINEYDEITQQMVEARGYGEEQPIVPNDNEENKKLNRRIEVLIWE